MAPNERHTGRQRLHFRRHLALVALLALAAELNHSLEHQLAHLAELYTGPAEVGEASSSWWSSVSGGASEGGNAGPGRRRARVRLAAAQEINQVAPEERAIYQYDTSEDLNPVARLLAEFQRHLPVINLNFSLAGDERVRFPLGQLDASIDLYYKEQFPANMSLDELTLMSVKAATRTSPIPLHTSFGYHTRELLRQASLPVLDDQLCSMQLQHLAKRLEQALELALKLADGQEAAGIAPSKAAAASSPLDNFEARRVYGAVDLELMRWLDSFGRVPADLLRGNIKWYGSYQSCMTTRLRPLRGAEGHGQPLGSSVAQGPRDQQAAIKFRYCLGALKSLGWRASEAVESERRQIAANRSRWTDYGVGTADINLNNYFLRLGLCLPEACDSSALEKRENAAALERLAKFGLARPFNSDHYQLADLYCLPDERSPLRKIPVLGKILLLVSLLWLALIGLATTVHLNVEKFYTKTVESIRSQRNRKLVRLLGREVLTASLSQEEQERRRRREEEKEDEHEDEEGDKDEDEKQNEFHESDILNVRLNWIKFNMFLQERARQIVPGVDLIDCLSLYANWLKYTRRIKLAIVDLHEQERAGERRRLENELLLQQALGDASAVLASVENNLGARGAQTNSSEPGQQQMLAGWKNRDARAQLSGFATKSPTAAAAAANRAETNEGRWSGKAADGQPIGRRVDTSSLNALKVIALVWIIAGHCIFYLGSAISNGALLSLYLPTFAAFALSNGAIYITELFFIITGCLTSYLAFKHNTQREAPSGPGGVAEEEGAEDDCEGAKEAPGSIKRQPQELGHSLADKSAPAGAGQCVMCERIFRAPFWSLVLLNRYLRILPTYLVVYGFVKLVSVYAGGQGQLWDYAVSENSMRRLCAQESWWPVLTLTTNFVDIYKHCIVGGWYLSVDMQFAMLAVPLLVLLAYAQRHFQRSSTSQSGSDDSLVQLRRLTAAGRERAKSPPMGPAGPEGSQQRARFVARPGRELWLSYGLVLVLALGSGLISVLYAMLLSPVDLSYIVSFSPHTIAIMSQNIAMYTNTLFRFRAFALGLLLGHALYLYEFRLVALPKFVQLHGSKLTVLLFSAGFCTMFLPILYPLGKIKLSHDVTAICTVLTALGVDVFACLLIFLVCVGKAPKLPLFLLNSPFWSLLSSLSLSAFVIHAEIIVLLSSQLDPPPSTSYALLLFLFSATLLLTYSLALALYLAFELPLSRLIEATMRSSLLVGRNLKERSPTANAATRTKRAPSGNKQ